MTLMPTATLDLLATLPREYNAAVDLISRNIDAGRAGKVAFIDDTGWHTYAEVAERAARWANVTRHLGVEMEQRVMLCLFDTVDFPDRLSRLDARRRRSHPGQHHVDPGELRVPRRRQSGPCRRGLRAAVAGVPAPARQAAVPAARRGIGIGQPRDARPRRAARAGRARRGAGPDDKGRHRALAVLVRFDGCAERDHARALEPHRHRVWGPASTSCRSPSRTCASRSPRCPLPTAWAAA